MILDDDLTEEQLAKLARVGTDEEKRAVAKHPNASLQTLLYLSKIDFADDVDRNPLLPLYSESGFDDIVKILEKIAEQTQRGERLEELASSIWNDVRFGVANNESTSPATFSLLAKDKEEVVRRAVAWNSGTPPDKISILAKDKSREVSRSARSTLAKLKKDRP